MKISLKKRLCCIATAVMTLLAGSTLGWEAEEDEFYDMDGTGMTADTYRLSVDITCAVFSGPGRDYLAPEDGIADIRSGETIQIYGRENGWVLIQYGVAEEDQRIAYIPEEVLPTDLTVRDLSFNSTLNDAVVTSTAPVTDDPLYSMHEFASIPDNTAVRWLSSLGDWAYIEEPFGSEKFRGFIPKEALTTEIVIPGMSITQAGQASGWLRGRAWLFAAGSDVTWKCLLFKPEGPEEGTVQVYNWKDNEITNFDEMVLDPQNPAWYDDGNTGIWSVEYCDGSESIPDHPFLKLLLTINGRTREYGLTMNLPMSYKPELSDKTYDDILCVLTLTDGENSGTWMECPGVDVVNMDGSVG